MENRTQSSRRGAGGARTVGVIGLGFGRAHVRAFQENGCRVVALCQRDLGRARAAAEKYGVPAAFERWEDLIERARPEIVAIAAPPYLHRAIAERAFEAGAHVLCEKPLALDANDARAIVDAARRSGKVGMTVFNWRFPPAMQRMHELIEEGALGPLWYAEARYLSPRWADATAAPTWRQDREQAGVGVLGDMGVHLLDLVQWNFGRIARVAASTTIAHRDRLVPGGARRADTEDVCLVNAELDSGAIVSAVLSRVARGRTEQTLEAHGGVGSLAYRLGREGPRWFAGELWASAGSGALEPVRIAGRFPRSAGEGDQIEVVGATSVAALVRRLVHAIEIGGDTHPAPSLEDGLRAQVVLDAAVEAARSGRWVEVEKV